MQGRVERPLLHLQHLVRQLADAPGNRPAVERLDGERLENQQVEGSLDEVDRLRGGLPMFIYTNSSR